MDPIKHYQNHILLFILFILFFFFLIQVKDKILWIH